MARHQSTSERILSALLIAAAVTLVVAGLLWFLVPRGAVEPIGTSQPDTAADVTATPDLLTTAPTEPPSRPTEPPVQTDQPARSADPPRSAASDPTPAPTAPPEPFREAAVATRVVVPSMDIDLPIVSRDRRVPRQGPDLYPPCDVAVYHTAFDQPGQPGTTYLYGHARAGMFLPLLEASERRNGRSLIGDLVQVYTDDNLMYLYEITRINRHATDFSMVFDAPPDAEQLVLQTSEGPRGTVPKLQVLAEKLGVEEATQREAHPRARPRGCYGE
jgi:hypothetical protein